MHTGDSSARASGYILAAQKHADIQGTHYARCQMRCHVCLTRVLMMLHMGRFCLKKARSLLRLKENLKA